MKLSKYLLLLLTCISISSIAQNHYNDLPLAEKIKVKEGQSPFYTSAKLGQGTNPIVQTTGPEQDCNSAIPVCQNVYTTSTSYSGVGANDEIPSNSCLGSNEKNSVWYTFNTSSSGNLAFNINPNSSSDDYDFALYDITGSNCSGIASGAITPIRCNFSATSGLTGLSSSGTNASEPASGSNQSTVLATTTGKTYVLIISNYSSSQSGYTLDFSPGTASIFDVTPPTIVGVTAPCGSNSVVFNASEQIKCNTIAANGSDFTITGTGGPYVVSAAAGQNCGVNTAQINLTISPALSGAGPWTVGVTTGSDGNTLIDPCGNVMLANTHTFTTSPPAVTISGPTSVCKGVVFALTASTASSYTWTGAAVPAGQQNQQTISITPSTAGTLNFTVTVSNGPCGNSTATQAVTIKEGPTAHFLASTHTVCAGTPVSFTTTSTIPCTLGGSGVSLCTCGTFGCGTTSQTNFNVLHTWSFSDPLSGTNNFGTGTPISHTFNTPGTYFVNLNTNFLIGGGCNTSETQTITVLPATPNLTVSPTTTICPGQSSTLTATGGTTYTWTPAATLNTPNGGTVIATPATTTIYTVSTPGCAGNQTATVQVVIGGTPPAIGAISGSTLICPNSTGITYSVANVASTNYTWTVPAGATITSAPTNSNAITVNFGASAGTVSVIAVGTCGSATAAVNVSISPALSLTVTPASSTVCAGSSTTLTASGATTYTWSPSATLSSANGTNVTATPLATTIYTVIGSTGTCIGSTTSTVTIGGALTLTVTPNSSTVCPGTPVTLTASGASNYTWSPSATLSSANGTTVSATPSVNTTYTVLGATGTCTGTATAIVTIGGSLTLTVTPNTSTVCAGTPVVLTASGATNYTWSPSATLSSANGATVTATPSTTTTYTVIGASGACTGSATANISMAAGLTLTLTSNTPTVCSTNPSALLDVNGATTYTWFPSATLSSANGSNVTASPLVNTTYTVLGSSGTCTGVATINIGIGVCVSSACDLALIRSTLTAAGNVELLGMNNTCSLYFINPQFMTGPQAQAYAQTFGANLISVQSASENADLVQALSNQGYAGQVIWIGFSDALLEGSFVWYDGSPISYTNWAPGEPNNSGGNENCTQIYPDGSWNDLNCAGYNSLSVIEVNICPQISVVSIPPTHCPFTNVTMNASTLLGSPNYTYTWAQSGAESFTTASTGTSHNDQITVTSMGPNTFTVYTEDRYSCPQSTTVNLTTFPSPTITANSATICAGQQTATLTANGATTYSWIPGTGLSATSGAVVTGTPASTQNYTVIGMDGNGCLNGTLTSIVVNSVPTISVSPDVTICPTNATVLSASGAASYTWSPSSSLSSANGASVTATPAAPTTYTVQGSSANGCPGTGTVNVNVSNNGFLPSVYIVQKNSLCDTTILNWVNITSVTPGLAQGVLPNGVTVNATHSGGGMSTTPSMFSGGSFPTTYSVPISSTTIRNDLGGTFNFCFSQPVINPQIAFASIGQVGLPITVNTSTPYQVLWTGSGMTYVSSTSMIGAEGFTIIRFPGVHSCITLDYIGNESYCNLAFGVMEADCQGQPLCPGTPIDLVGNGATSYTWSTGANTSTITPVPFTTTTYTVTGANSDGCVNTAVTTVTVNPTPTITVNSSTICAGQQTATLTANGASTYTWSPGTGLSATTGSVVTGTPASTQNYTITGTDTNGCINDTTASIIVNPIPTVTANSATICIGQQTATLVAAGAATYSWTPAANLSSSSGTTVTGTPAVSESYTITGTDVNGCTNTGTSTITVNSLPTITANSATICVGQQTATLTANGATTYSWIPGTGLSSTTGSMVTGTPVTTENYTVVGMDANGCISGTTTAITVNSLPIITANSSTICVGQQTATLTANGATTYSWIPGTGLSATTGSVVTGTPVTTQNYTVAGMDANGCISGTITSITVNILPTVTVNSASICIGQQTATLIANGANTYSWTSPVNLSASSGATVTGTPAVTESYTITGTDANGCTSSATSTITVNSLPTVTVNSSTICVGQQTATLTAVGANTYSWSPSTDLSSGTGSPVTGTPTVTQSYSVTGTDLNGCFSGNTSTITVNTLPIVTVNTATICVGQQTATLTANGATTYSWIPGTGLSATTGSMVTGTPTVTQSYTVGGIDANGCIGGTTTTITVNPLPIVTVSPDMTVCPLSANTLTASGAATYTWSPNIYLNTNTAASVICTPSVTTTYTIDATSAASCTNSAVMTIVVANTVVVNATASTSTICPLASSSLTATGATSYTWSPSLTLSSPNGSVVTASPATSTTYTVIGSTSTCTNSTQVVITLTVNPTLTVTPSPAVICSGSSSGLSASGASTYTWSPAATLSSANGALVHANPNTTTVYNITGTSPLGCLSSTSTTITVVPTPTVSATANPVTICAGSTTTLNAVGATDYTWSPAASISNPTVSPTAASPAFTTTYTVIGSNGTAPFVCTDTKTVQVLVIQNPTLTPGPPVPICEGQSTLIYATGANTYTWSPPTGVSHIHDSTTNVRPPLPGVFVYTVTGTTNNCTGTATVQVTVNALPIVDAGKDSTINIDQTIVLFGTGDTQVGFINASTGVAFDCNYCPTVTVNPQESTCYTLEGISSFGCRNTDDVCITVTKDWDVFIPNAFTPNGDIHNEVFAPVGYGIDKMQLLIFDRWGTQIYKGEGQSVGWDGTFKGRTCEQGVYIYKAEITAMSGEKYYKTGHVTLIGKVK